MKKGKTILAATVLGVLATLAWLGSDRKHPESAVPVMAPAAAPGAKPVPSLSLATAAPARRQAARNAVRSHPVTTKTQAKPSVARHSQEVPLPSGWNGHFAKQDLRGQTNNCDIDRPCSPRGRDGVLLLGASFALNGLRPEMPQSLSVGSYERRTPLLVYK